MSKSCRFWSPSISRRLTSDEIKQVLNYVENYVPEVKEVVDVVVEETEEEVFSTDIYLILFITILLL